MILDSFRINYKQNLSCVTDISLIFLCCVNIFFIFFFHNRNQISLNNFMQFLAQEQKVCIPVIWNWPIPEIRGNPVKKKGIF